MTAIDVRPYRLDDSVDPSLRPLLALLETVAAAGDLPALAPGLGEAEGMTVRELATAPYTALDEIIEAEMALWNAPRHVAATLWWKSFAYWSAIPIALGWALNGTFPSFTAENTLIRVLPDEPRMLLGMRELAPATDVRATLQALHAPLIEALAKLTRAGRRNLWGSVAESLTRPLTSFAELLPGSPDPAALLERAGAPVSGLMEAGTGRRRTCCLWVTLPGNEACASCCLG